MGRKRRCGKHAPRASWGEYGITRRRWRALTFLVRSGGFDNLALQAAREASGAIAGHILLSVAKRLSYEGVEYAQGLGRIPCGRTDFYGYRRLFYHIFNKKLMDGEVMDAEKSIRWIEEMRDSAKESWGNEYDLRQCDEAVEFIRQALADGKIIGRAEMNGKLYIISEV